MNWQPLPSLLVGRDEGAGACQTPPTKSLLVLAGTAVLLLGCQQDPVGTAPGGLEPSASSQQSGDPDDNGAGARNSNSGEGSGASDSNDAGDAGNGADSGSDTGSDSGSGDGSGSAN